MSGFARRRQVSSPQGFAESFRDGANRRWFRCRRARVVPLSSATVADLRASAGMSARAGEPLTVLQVIPSLNAGGAERTTIDLARALTAAGFRALVASEGGRLEP